MTTKHFLLSSIVFLLIVSACNNNSQKRTITVIGSSEMDIEPDEIVLVIGIREYWKDEYENKKHTNYNKKIPINEIEDTLTNKLVSFGIDTSDISISRINNYWRYWYVQTLLIQKQLNITVRDFENIDKIITKINFKGIDYIQVQEYKNTEITEYRKAVKIKALKAAKEKAEYLLEAYNKTIGEVITIVEINNDAFNPNSPYYPYYYYRQERSNYLSNSNEGSSNSNENSGFKKINLRYEMEVTFLIK